MKNVGHSDKQARKLPTPGSSFPVGPSGVAAKGNTLGGGPKSDGKSYGKK